MSNPTLDAQVAAAKAYEALFVPALFGQWAPTVVGAANLVAGESVLDVACGTGVLAREAHLRTGPKGYVAGLDPSDGMLAVAKELSPSLDWQQGTAEAMPFPDAAFDVVVSQFGLMFMNRDRAVHEMLRVLKPNGRLVVAVWDTVQNIPAYAAEIALLERLAGTQAAEALRAPFVLGNRELLAKVFSDAGASSITISTPKGIARFPSIRVMVEADLRGWLPVMGVNLTKRRLAASWKRRKAYLVHTLLMMVRSRSMRRHTSSRPRSHSPWGKRRITSCSRGTSTAALPLLRLP